MTRFVSLFVVLALLVGSAAPLAAAVRPETGMPMDICPMMDHTPKDEPCIGQPCPCHGNGTEQTTLPDGTRLALPEARATRSSCARVSVLAPSRVPDCEAGFLASIDHPPDLRP